MSMQTVAFINPVTFITFSRRGTFSSLQNTKGSWIPLNPVQSSPPFPRAMGVAAMTDAISALVSLETVTSSAAKDSLQKRFLDPLKPCLRHPRLRSAAADPAGMPVLTLCLSPPFLTLWPPNA